MDIKKDINLTNKMAQYEKQTIRNMRYPGKNKGLAVINTLLHFGFFVTNRDIENYNKVQNKGKPKMIIKAGNKTGFTKQNNKTKPPKPPVKKIKKIKK